MKLFYILLVITVTLQAQSSRKGSITTTDGNTVSGYIINFDRTEEITVIQYKEDAKGALQSFPAAEVKEVNFKKKNYIIAQVQIDNRTNNLNKLRTASRMEDFRFSDKTLALEILVDGEATLYRTYLNLVEKFFFKINDRPIAQLLYKKYFLPRGSFYLGSDGAVQNKEYLKQLFNHVKCINKKGEMFYPDFDKPSLKKYFERYNKGNCL